MGAVCFSHQAQVNPRKLLAGLAGELHIYEHTKAQKLTGTQCITNRGRIRAQKVIVATHFPLLNKRGVFFLKLYQQRSYVLALKNVDGPAGMYIDAEPGGLSAAVSGLLSAGRRRSVQGTVLAMAHDLALREPYWTHWQAGPLTGERSAIKINA